MNIFKLGIISALILSGCAVDEQYCEVLDGEEKKKCKAALTDNSTSDSEEEIVNDNITVDNESLKLVFTNFGTVIPYGSNSLRFTFNDNIKVKGFGGTLGSGMQYGYQCGKQHTGSWNNAPYPIAISSDNWTTCVQYRYHPLNFYESNTIEVNTDWLEPDTEYQIVIMPLKNDVWYNIFNTNGTGLKEIVRITVKTISNYTTY